MATWAIGDIQGCFESFERLIETIRLDLSRDRLWLVGDLVNRGPRSLDALRWVYAHRAAVTVVLGNHDLHLLALHLGVARPRKSDTLDDILAAPDRDELLAWLRQQPLLHREGELVMVHAGLHPEWHLEDAVQRARAAEVILRSDDALALLARDTKHDDRRIADARETVATLTRIRMLDRDGNPRSDYAGPPESAPSGYIPWFDAPKRRATEATIVFGHWAALGRRLRPRLLALDSGCVWGNELTALRLEDRSVIAQASLDAPAHRNRS